MKIEHSEFATSYAGALHSKRAGRAPTWADVAGAYDAGIHHAIAVTPVKRAQLIRYFRALHVINAARVGTRK